MDGSWPGGGDASGMPAPKCPICGVGLPPSPKRLGVEDMPWETLYPAEVLRVPDWREGRGGAME